MTKHKPDAFTRFYAEQTPQAAVALAIADHLANDPLGSAEFVAALRKAEERCESYRKLVEALRQSIAADPSQAEGDGHLAAGAALLRELGESE